MNSKLDRLEAGVNYHFGEKYMNLDLKRFIPRSYQLKSFESLKSPDLLSKCMYFWSKKNLTGKSTYLSLIYREIIKRYGYGVTKVFSDSELQSQCRQSWLENDDDFMKNHYKNYKFFIFKDFGKATIGKDEVQAFYFDFMDYLYSNTPPKVLYFASNYAPSELKTLGGRNWEDIAARINELCEVHEVN